MEPTTLTTIMPAAPGWRAAYTQGDGTVVEEPLIGWARRVVIENTAVCEVVGLVRGPGGGHVSDADVARHGHFEGYLTPETSGWQWRRERWAGVPSMWRAEGGGRALPARRNT